jgi:hypothetical protein
MMTLDEIERSLSMSELTKKFYEIWGLTFEGGEERTYDLLNKVVALERRKKYWKDAHSVVTEVMQNILWLWPACSIAVFLFCIAVYQVLGWIEEKT